MQYKSRTDLNTTQLPNPIPTMGPAGSIVTDPDFGNPIVRVTDGTTQTSPYSTLLFMAGAGGSSDVNSWNTDSTVLAIQNSGGASLLFGFDPATLAVKRLYPTWSPGGGAVFSKTNPNTLFVQNGTKITKYDLTDRTLQGAPPSTLFCDFANILPAPIKWSVFGGVEGMDSVATCAFSTTGGQGTGVYVCAYIDGSGYRMWNTLTGVVTGTFGPLGSISLPDQFYIHNVKASKGPYWLVVSDSSHVTGTVNTGGPYFWDVDSLNVTAVSRVWSGGHFTTSDQYFFNAGGPGFGNFVYRQMLTPAKTSLLLTASQIPKGFVAPCDNHACLNGNQPVNMLFLTNTDTGKYTVLNPATGALSSYPSAWYNEVQGISLDGSGLVYRFCHTFITGKSGNFSAANAIGVVDQQGKFFAFTSDWMGQTGRAADVYIVKLQ